MKRNFFVVVLCIALFSVPSFAMRDVRGFEIEEVPFVVDFDWDLGEMGNPEKEECGSPSFCYIIPIINKPNNYVWMRGYKNTKDNLFEWTIFLLQVEYFPVEGYEDAVWVGFTDVFIPRNDGKYNNDWRSIGHELIPKDYPPYEGIELVYGFNQIKTDSENPPIPLFDKDWWESSLDAVCFFAKCIRQQ